MVFDPSNYRVALGDAMARRILLIEADPDTTELLRGCLELLGCIVDTESDGNRAVARLGEGDYSGIILNMIIPGVSGLEVLRQLRQGGSTLPVIAISGNAVEKEVIREGAEAFLAKPFPIREFKRVVQRVIPPTRDELIQDHSGGESTVWQKALALAKAGDFIGARKAIELLDETNSQRMGLILLLAYQVRAGDIAGAKETVLGAPSLRLGGHWVRCMTNSLVKAGDGRGALAIVDNLTSDDERAFHKPIIVAQQVAAGDLSGAKATLLQFSPSEIGRNQAIGAIANALVTAGNFEEAISLVCQMDNEETRAEAIGEILHAQKQRGDISDAERTAASIDNKELKRQAFEVIERIYQQRYEQTHILMVCEISWVGDTFSNMYPVD